MSPPGKKILLSSPEDWIAHAQSDLRMAKLGRVDVAEAITLAENFLVWARDEMGL